MYPFALAMSLGERISPFSISNIRGVPLNVEPLSDARTPLADFFSILLEGFSNRFFAELRSYRPRPRYQSYSRDCST